MTIAALGLFLLLVCLVVVLDKFLSNEGRCKDLTGDIYNYIVPSVVSRKDLDLSILVAPIKYTPFNLKQYPSGRKSLIDSVDLYSLER